MNETIQSWIDRAAAQPGVMACGVRLADRTFTVKSCRDGLTEPQVTQAMRELSEAAYALQQNHIAADRLRWTFENSQLRCVVGAGGVIAALLLAPEAADSPGIDQLFSEFALAVA
jgi:hypothetical protein